MNKSIRSISVLNIAVILLAMIVTICGICSFQTGHFSETVNQCGEIVKMWGSGIYAQVELCNQYKLQLPQIEARLKELEQAAKLIDKSIARHLTLLKLSCGMDSLSSLQKEHSASFANALNAIEGVYASKTTQQNIDKWKAGDESFVSIFKSTLNMYGFTAEV